MPIIEVTVVPLGTGTASVSAYVAEVHRVLEEAPEPIRFEMTAMSTLIEGELDDLFAVVRRMHEAPFEQGVARVSTSIRIDDRRDKTSTIESKLLSVREKIDHRKKET